MILRFIAFFIDVRGLSQAAAKTEFQCRGKGLEYGTRSGT